MPEVEDDAAEVVDQDEEISDYCHSSVATATNIDPMDSTTSTHPMYIEIDGKLVHKCQAVNSILNKTRTSRDRVFRVRGTIESQMMPKNVNESGDSENLTRVTDTIATIAKLHTQFIGLVIFSINKIKSGGRFVDSIDSSLLHTAQFYGTMLKIKSFDDDYLYWTGTYGESIVCQGEFCVNILTKTIAVKDKSDCTGFSMEYVDKAIDLLTSIYGKHLAESINVNTILKQVRSPYCNEKVQNYLLIQDLAVFNNKSDKVQCDTCHKQVLKIRMRNHIGKHLILDEIDAHPKNCGMCGNIGCSISLVTPGRGRAAVTAPASDCKYFEKFSLGAAKKSSGLQPCTNIPVKCQACNNSYVFWSYNMTVHYKLDHPSLIIPDFMSKDEIKKVKNLIV